MNTMAWRLLVGLAMLSGCGADAFSSEEGANQEPVGIASEALGETTCFTTAAYDVKICTGCSATQPLNWTSPQTYTHPDCSKAVIADILDYSPTYSGPGDVPGGIYVNWADAVPTTPTTCRSAYLAAELYVQGGTVIGNKSAFGQWIVAGPIAGCSPPGVSFTSEIPVRPGYGGIYRTVVSARTTQSSLSPTRKVRIQQRAPVFIK